MQRSSTKLLALFVLVGMLAPLPAGAAALAQGGSEESASTVALPVIILVVVVLALSVGRRVFAGGGGSRLSPSEPGRIRNYGAAGGAVCRSCGLPFARSVLDLNLLVGKLVRCPHCGKWGVLPAASPAELELAEERERGKVAPGAAPAVVEPGEEERLRRRIDESRYE